MAQQSKIEWTESTWNPVTGCTKISPGCKHCYAERMAKRLKAMGQKNYAKGFRCRLHEHMLELPLHWKKPQVIFVNSMSDLFHRNVTDLFIRRVFEVMEQAHWHIFQILTKRSDRLVKLAPSIPWPKNVWMGVSVENQDYTFRIDHLRRVNSSVRFISFEPLLGPIPDLNIERIDWVVVGGESGHKARLIDAEWVLNIRDQCQVAEVPFFFKQWGGKNKKKAGRILEHKTYNEMPYVTDNWNDLRHDQVIAV